MADATPPTAALADLSLNQDDDQNLQAASPNTLMVDAPEEHLVEPNGAETDDVAIINPDAMDTDTLLATDRTLPRFPPLSAVRLLTRPQMRP